STLSPSVQPALDWVWFLIERIKPFGSRDYQLLVLGTELTQFGGDDITAFVARISDSLRAEPDPDWEWFHAELGGRDQAARALRELQRYYRASRVPDWSDRFLREMGVVDDVSFQGEPRAGIRFAM